MKKNLLTIIVMMLIVALALGACGKEEKVVDDQVGGNVDTAAYEIYNAMNTALAAVTYLEMDYTMDIQMSDNTDALAFSMAGSGQQLISSPTEVEFVMQMSMDLSQLSLGIINMDMYYTDGYIYQDMMGMRYKMPLDTESALEQAGVSEFDFDEEAIIDASVVDVDGGKQLTFSLDANKMNGMIDEMAQSQLGSLGITDDSGVVIDAVQCFYVVDEDNLPISQLITISMTMNMEGETMQLTMEMQMTYGNFNAKDSIEFPADLAEYQDYDQMLVE